MQLSTLRPYVTTGVALVGASVIAVTPIAIPQDQAAPAQRSIAVAPAAVTNDLAAAFAALAQADGASTQALIAGLGSTPDALAKVAAAGIDDPELIPSLLSAVIYGILSQPGPTGNPNQSLISSVTAPIVMALAQLLPPPVGFDDQAGEPGLLLGAGIQLAQAINDALALLPDPVPGTVAAQGTQLPDAVASVTESIQLLVSSGLANSAFLLAAGLGYAPATILAVGQAAADNPEDIPGLLSFLVNGVLRQPAPDGNPESLMSLVSAPTAIALAQTLPAPIGATFNNQGQMTDPGLLLIAGIELGKGINAVLDVLPDPVNPLAQQAVLRAGLAVQQDSDPLDIAGALASGFGESGVRLAKGLALAPLGPLAAAASIADGAEANTAVYSMLRNYIDAPLWTVDPSIDALKVALPDRAADITSFRDNVLWKATFNVREPIREALGVAPGTGDQTPQVQQSRELSLTQVSGEKRQLTGKTDEKDAASTKTSPRSPFKLKLRKDRAADTATVDAASAGSTEAKPGPRHRPGPGKVSVRNLFKGARD